MSEPISLGLDQFVAMQMIMAMFSVFVTGLIRLVLKVLKPDLEKSKWFTEALPYLSVLCGSLGVVLVYLERGGILVGGVDYGILVHAASGGVGGAVGPMLYDQFTKTLYARTDAIVMRIFNKNVTIPSSDPLIEEEPKPEEEHVITEETKEEEHKNG